MGKISYSFVINAFQFKNSIVSEIEPSLLKNLDDGIWVHCQRDDPQLKIWLEDLDVPKAAIDALLANDSRPRFEIFDQDCSLIIVRGINLNNGFQPDDMLSLRFLIYRGAIISTRKIPSLSVSSVCDRIKNHNDVPLSMIIILILNEINKNIFNYLDPVEEALDKISENTISNLMTLQKKLLNIRRYLKPQKYVICEMLKQNDSLISEQRDSIKNILDDVIRINESIEFYIEQINATIINMNQIENEKMNVNTYALSIVSILFLPASFFTGLFGINILGIPGSENTSAFMVFCIFIVILIALEILIMKTLKFI
ncbi:CorA family divalent cation transporter [Photobacterium damselae]|uniref:CorA family divalent cation transporter n=1 Tax=Photobacterium damselae TaxID=38293 RepID=UPI0015E7B5C9|nr:CorA family divalent cation transporter [Photobacterium damselae]